ncbi:MAG TPA: hypothetical protein PK358_05600 [Spirochaetota bacterium]|nr:hypothetical protein [Spirochaetota bacterium]
MKFFAAVIHIWFLGVMPLLALVKLVFNPEIYKSLQEVVPPSLVLGGMICGIAGIFFVIAYSFFIGEFYLEASDEVKITSFDYYMMIASPFTWMLLVYFLNPGDLLMEAVESGAIALVSQHTALHFVHFLVYRERQEKDGRGLFAFFFLILVFIMFLVISVNVYAAMILMEESILWNIVFTCFLVSAIAGSFRFFYRNRSFIWKISTEG